MNLKLRRRTDASVCLSSSSSRRKKHTGCYPPFSGREYSMTSYYVNKKALASGLTPITFWTHRRLRFRKDCLDGRVGVDDKAATTNRELRESDTESTESEVTCAPDPGPVENTRQKDGSVDNDSPLFIPFLTPAPQCPHNALLREASSGRLVNTARIRSLRNENPRRQICDPWRYVWIACPGVYWFRCQRL